MGEVAAVSGVVAGRCRTAGAGRAVAGRRQGQVGAGRQQGQVGAGRQARRWRWGVEGYLKIDDDCGYMDNHIQNSA